MNMVGIAGHEEAEPLTRQGERQGPGSPLAAVRRNQLPIDSGILDCKCGMRDVCHWLPSLRYSVTASPLN